MGGSRCRHSLTTAERRARLRLATDWCREEAIIAAHEACGGKRKSESSGQPGEGVALQITVNAEPRDVQPGTTVAELLQQLNRQPHLVAVERNGELIPRTRHAECQLQAGDRVEVVTLVGGG